MNPLSYRLCRTLTRGLALSLLIGGGTALHSQPVQAQAAPNDASVVKTADVSTAQIGDTVVYTITITAEAVDTVALDVNLDDPIPSQLDFVSLGGADNAACFFQNTPPAIICDFGDINQGDPDRVITVTATVNDTAVIGSTVTNTVTIDSPNDPNDANNSSSADVDIVGPTTTPTPSPTPAPLTPSPIPAGVLLNGTGCSLAVGAEPASAFYLLGMVGIGMAALRRRK